MKKKIKKIQNQLNSIILAFAKVKFENVKCMIYYMLGCNGLIVSLTYNSKFLFSHSKKPLQNQRDSIHSIKKGWLFFKK